MSCPHPETDTPEPVEHDAGHTLWQTRCLVCGALLEGWGNASEVYEYREADEELQSTQAPPSSVKTVSQAAESV